MINFLKIFITSPNNIIFWSLKIYKGFYKTGLITEPYTIYIKTGLPIPNGIFCEKIFGPVKSWSCRCGFLNIFKYYKKYNLCYFCGVEYNNNNIRRYNMGYIILFSKFINKFYFKSDVNYLSILLNKSNYMLNKIIYFKNILIKNINYYIFKNIFKNKLLSFSKLGQGVNLIYLTLQKINIIKELNFYKNLILIEKNIIYKNIINKKIRLLNMFFLNKIKPEWLLLSVLPVLPAGLRPIIFLNFNKIILSTLNLNYIMIIIRNNRLLKWFKIKQYISPLYEIIEKKLLQYNIDNLFFNKTLNKNNFSLSKSLITKKGLFHLNLLGKRIDFSARSLIISGPNINLDYIGLPFLLCNELFKPFIIKYLKNILYINKNKLLLNYFINNLFLLDFKYLLITLIKTKLIILNRAPTLHKLNIQAFKINLINNKAIYFNPLVCKSYNADFDGDQVSLFLPITKESQKEANLFLLSSLNLYLPRDNTLIKKFSQDSILGIYYIIYLNILKKYKIKYFSNLYDFLIYYYLNKLNLNEIISFRLIYIYFNYLFKLNIIFNLNRFILFEKFYNNKN